MAAAFELQYPAGGPYELSWIPEGDHEPDTEGSGIDQNDGLLVDVMADAKTQHAFRISDTFQEYFYNFEHLSAADKASFDTFLATARGKAFDFKDATMGSSYVKVRFAPDGVRRSWRRQPVTDFAVSIRLRDAE